MLDMRYLKKMVLFVYFLTQTEMNRKSISFQMHQDKKASYFKLSL